MGEDMDRFAISATLEARPGKEGEVEQFLKSAQPLAIEEAGTTTWFAFRIGPATFGIFDTFADEAGLQAHLNGEIAKALFAKAEELFAKPPQIQKVEIFAAKPLS
jgi:quinol monooxygenase YgiN